MKVATKANVRTTNAAQDSLGKALEIAFSGGSVMGMGVVGLGVLGIGSLFILYEPMFDDINTVIQVISGFSLGASSIGLFAGGWINEYFGWRIAFFVVGIPGIILAIIKVLLKDLLTLEILLKYH